MKVKNLLYFLIIVVGFAYSCTPSEDNNSTPPTSNQRMFKSISGSFGSHSIGITEDGKLWVWGNNQNGQLGQSVPYIYYNKLTQIGIDTDWRSVFTGDEHNIGLKNDGSLWGWGQNVYGQLGDGTNNYRNVPTRIGTDSDWNIISTGSNHVMGIKTDGSLWGWGSNNNGQLGNGNNSSNVPIRIGMDNDWKAISCGGNFSLAIKNDGSLWSWGNNFLGQLGMGNSAGSTINVPTRVGGTDNDWKLVVAGAYTSFALKTDGSLWAWGDNFEGILGLQNITDDTVNVPTRLGNDYDWKNIVCGNSFTLAIKNNGSLWGWGLNNYGQLGDGTNMNRNLPVQITNSNDWKTIGSGYSHSFGIKNDGSLWAWGINNYGQLGIGNYNNMNVPVRVQ